MASVCVGFIIIIVWCYTSTGSNNSFSIHLSLGPFYPCGPYNSLKHVGLPYLLVDT